MQDAHILLSRRPFISLPRTDLSRATNKGHIAYLSQTRRYDHAAYSRPTAALAVRETTQLRGNRFRHATYTSLATEVNDGQNRAQYWLKTLQDSHRIDRLSLPRIWKEFKNSGDTLPMQGDVANKIWGILVDDHRLHHELFEHALQVKSESGITFDRLYEYLIGRLLRIVRPADEIHKTAILNWHQRFLDKYFIRPGALNELVHIAIRSRSNLELFRSIYRRSSCLPRQGIYDALVPEMCKLNEWPLAIEWHFFLYSQRDYARNSNFLTRALHSRPTLQEALAEFIDKHLHMHPSYSLEDDSSTDPAFGKKSLAVFNPSSLSNIGDDAFKAAVANMDQKPRHAPLSDEFCARLLATRGVSIASVIDYYEMFDHGKLGPLALRELMARSKSLQEAIDNLQAFDDADIQTGLSVYPQTIRHFLNSSQYDLLQNLIGSDLHPDTLQNYDLQKRLLKHYTTQSDQLSARRTIEILRIIDPPEKGPGTALATEVLTNHSSTINATFLRKIGTNDDGRRPQEIQLMIDDQLSQGLRVTNRAMSALIEFFRPTAKLQMSEKENMEKHDLTFISNALLLLMKAKHSIPPVILKWIMISHGVRGQLHPVFRIFAFFVTQYYGRPQIAQQSQQLGSQKHRMTNPWHELQTYADPGHTASLAITHHLQMTALNIIEWGYKAALPLLSSTEQFHSNPAVVYLVGLRFLSQLSGQGFPLNQTAIAAKLGRRLVLSHCGSTSSRLRNQNIATANYFTLEEMLVAIEETWSGDTLFPELYNDPGVNVDRDLHPKPKYYMSQPDLFLDQAVYSTPSSHVEDPWLRSGREKPWGHTRWDALRARYGGSMLDGLICVNAASDAPRLPRHERIEKRIHVRYFFFGTAPISQYKSSQSEWDRDIRRSAIQADRDLVHHGLCQVP